MHVNSTLVMFETCRDTIRGEGGRGGDDVVWSSVVSLRQQKRYRDVLFSCSYEIIKHEQSISVQVGMRRSMYVRVCVCVCILVYIAIQQNIVFLQCYIQFPLLGHCSFHWPCMDIQAYNKRQGIVIYEQFHLLYNINTL